MNKISLAQTDLITFSMGDLQLLANNLGIFNTFNRDELAWLLARKIHSKKAHMFGKGDYHQKSVLVTGGAGFIGSNLVDALLKAGAKKVRVLDNLSTGHRSNLIDAERHTNFDFVQGDIRSLKTCEQACKGINMVFHEAALVSVPKSMQDPILNNDINITGTLNMLIAAATAGVERFVYASSAAVYGADPEIPKKESMQCHYPSPYALSKGVDEDYAGLWAYNVELGHGMTCIGLRYFNVYGPRQDPKSPYSGVISIFADRVANLQDITIFGDGSQTRDFVFIADVVRANLLAGLYGLETGKSRVYNVGTGKSVTLLELLAVIEGIIGTRVSVSHGPERLGDIKHSLADISKIRGELGYHPEHRLQDGLRLLLKN